MLYVYASHISHVFCLRIWSVAPKTEHMFVNMLYVYASHISHVFCLRISHVVCCHSYVIYLVMTVAFTPTLNRRCTTLCVYTERALLRISSTLNLQQTKAICKARLHFSPATKGKKSISWKITFRARRYSMASKKCQNRRYTKHI